MAKTIKVKTDKLDIDKELDNLNFDDIDAQFSAESKQPKKRNPVTEVFTGTIKGATNKFTDPSFLASIAKKALPEELEIITNVADQVIAPISSLYDNAVKEIKPQASRLAKKIDKLVPENQKLLKKASSKFKNLIGDETDSFKGPSKETLNEQAIANSLAKVFEANNEKEENKEARKLAESSVKDNIETKRFSSNFGLLTSINTGITYLRNYEEKITNAYQKKSLELQFRSYFTQVELLNSSKTFFEITNRQNESIIKNTALPEFVKIKNSERFAEVAKTRFATSIQNSMFGDKSAIQNAIKKLSANVKQQIAGFKSGLETGISALESIETSRETLDSMQGATGETTTGYNLAGELIGDQLAERYGKKLGKYLRGKLPTDSPLARTVYKGANIASNIPGNIKDLGKSKFVNDNYFDDGIKGFGAKILSSIVNLFDTNGPDMALAGASNLGTLNDPGMFNNKTQKSITEVIPGFLSRIHREILMLRTKDNSKGLTVFDYKTGKFVNEKKLSKDIKDNLKSKLDSSTYKNRIKDIQDLVLGDTQLGAKQDTKIKDFISKLALTKTMNYSPENIKDTDLFKALDPETSKLISEGLDKNITNSDNDDLSKLKLTKSMMGLREAAPDIRAEIEAFVNAGYADILEEHKLITRDKDGSVIINFDEYQKLLKESNIVSSDKFIKRNIKKINPKKALDAIKKTKIYNWLYKAGKGDDIKHTGPMAQDVNANMGEESAPNGTAIDLTSMNGMNMAAIQAMREEQEKLSKSDSSKTILIDINNNIKQIVKLLTEKINFSNSGANQANANDSNAKTKGNSYKDLFKDTAGNVFDLVTKIGSDIYSKGSSTILSFKNKITDPLFKYVKDKVNDNKDSIKSTFSKLFGKAGELASSIFDISKDVVINKLPAGFKTLAVIGSKVKDTVLELINRSKDIYVKGRKDPILRAALMRMGYYYDQATMTVIKSVKDIKGTVVNKAGEVVATAEDFVEGMFDSDGNIIDTPFVKAIKVGLGLAKKGLSRIKTFATKAIDVLGSGGNAMFNKIKSLFSSVGSNSKSYNVLVEIRDILKRHFNEETESSYSNANNDSSGFKPLTGSTWTERFENMTENMRNKNPKYAAAKNSVSAISKAGKSILGKSKNIINSVKSAKGLKGKTFAALGSLFGGSNSEEQSSANNDSSNNSNTNSENNETNDSSNNQDKTSIISDVTNKIKKHMTGLKDKVKVKFNDRDASGERDGSWKDRLEQLAERNKLKNKDPAKADLSQRYRSDQNILDTIMEKASALFGFLTKGVSGIFGAASGIFTSVTGMLAGKGILGSIVKGLGAVVKAPFKLLKGMSGVARTVGTPLVAGVKAIKNVGLVSNIVSKIGLVRNALMVGGLLTGGAGGVVLGGIGAAMSAVGAILASPVVLGAAAIAAAGIGAYYAYKSFTKDDTDEFIDLRLKQYGLTNTEKDKHHNHEILELEAYLEDGAIGYGRSGAYILEKKVDVQKIFSIFSIDTEDKDRVESFLAWFQKRFKPFFLTHLTALYAVNSKIKLNNIKKLIIEEQSKYMSLISFENGPYDISDSPFNDIDNLSTDKDLVDYSIKLLNVAIKKGFKDKAKNTPNASDKKIKEPPIPKPKQMTDVIDNRANIKLPDTANQPVRNKMTFGGLFAGNDSSYQGEEASVNSTSQSNANTYNGTGSVSIPKLADGPISSGTDASKYIKLQPGVNLKDLNPAVYKNFMAMADEYGKLTNKTIPINSAYRSMAQQEAEYRRDPSKAAKPGRSMHQFGLAIDINSNAANELDKLGLMRKYGFTRPVGGETWHMEPAGIQGNLSGAKEDPALAAQLTLASLYKGGGGVGSSKNYPKGRRDTSRAIKLMNIANTSITNKSSNDSVYADRKNATVLPINTEINNRPINTSLVYNDVNAANIEYNKDKLSVRPIKNEIISPPTPRVSSNNIEEQPIKKTKIFKAFSNGPRSEHANNNSGIGSEIINRNISNIDDTLSRSLNIQEQMLEALKIIVVNSDPNNFNELKTNILKLAANKNSNSNNIPRSVPNQGLDLRRKAS